MCNWTTVLLIVALSAAIVQAEETATTTLVNSGYSINVLDPGSAQAGGFQAFQMLLPPQDGFSSNVNVQHQAYAGSLRDYAALSEAGAKKVKLKVIDSALEEEAYTAEAIGKVPGVDIELHFYFKAIKAGENVILATATIPVSRWDKDKELLLPIVDSLVATKK